MARQDGEQDLKPTAASKLNLPESSRQTLRLEHIDLVAVGGAYPEAGISPWERAQVSFEGPDSPPCRQQEMPQPDEYLPARLRHSVRPQKSL